MGEEKKDGTVASIKGAAAGSGSASAGVRGVASISGHAIRARAGGSSLDTFLSPNHPAADGRIPIVRPIREEEWPIVAKLFSLEDEKRELIGKLDLIPGLGWKLDPRAGTITFTKE